MLAAQASTHQTPARNDAKAFILDYLKDGERETADLDSMMKARGFLVGHWRELKRNKEGWKDHVQVSWIWKRKKGVL